VNTQTNTHHYLCIGCPLGCRLEVEEDEFHTIVEVRGFSCKKGKEFAQQEHIDPRRMVTTTVAITGGRWTRLPVRTQEAIPKNKVLELCKRLRTLSLKAPITMGEIVLANALDTGISVIASRDMPEA
jgi:CxxC motif-containing protein